MRPCAPSSTLSSSPPIPPRPTIISVALTRRLAALPTLSVNSPAPKHPESGATLAPARGLRFAPIEVESQQHRACNACLHAWAEVDSCRSADPHFWPDLFRVYTTQKRGTRQGGPRRLAMVEASVSERRGVGLA